PPTVSEIRQPAIIYVQEPTQLRCIIRGVRQREIKVKWLRLRSSPDSVVSSESASLLLSEDLSEQACLHSEGKHHTSVLTIISIPQVPKVERLLVLCCRVEKFYPQEISLEWSRNDGEEVRTVTHFGPFSDHSRLYSVWSKIQLVMAQEDERAVYTCRVYHSSFPSPGFRDVLYHINTQGTPPKVMFDCEPLCPLLNKECILHLCIKDFCPEDVSVIWTKDRETLLSGITPNTDVQGSEFRCQVVHSAQKEPEERLFTLPHLHLTE
ncbi:hypothetical protein INR49_031860, partial [Caranx melampygus]